MTESSVSSQDLKKNEDGGGSTLYRRSEVHGWSSHKWYHWRKGEPVNQNAFKISLMKLLFCDAMYGTKAWMIRPAPTFLQTVKN